MRLVAKIQKYYYQRYQVGCHSSELPLCESNVQYNRLQQYCKLAMPFLQISAINSHSLLGSLEQLSFGSGRMTISLRLLQTSWGGKRVPEVGICGCEWTVVTFSITVPVNSNCCSHALYLYRLSLGAEKQICRCHGRKRLLSLQLDYGPYCQRLKSWITLLEELLNRSTHIWNTCLLLPLLAVQIVYFEHSIVRNA